jgi:hypothetical protein
MLRKNEVAIGSTTESLRHVLAYVPASSGLYRAWTMPDRDKLTAALQSLIAPEQPQAAVFQPPAPEVNAEAADVGSETDLEVRIDEPPIQRTGNLSVAPVVDAIMAMQPEAVLHVQTTRTLRDQVFVMPSGSVVIACQQPDGEALNRALTQVRRPLGPGLIDPVNVALNGNIIVLSRLDLRPNTSTAIAVPGNTTYIAVYNHAAEWPRYKKLFGILDRTPSGPEGPMTPNGAPFFSGNLESLGDCLPRLQKASIFSRDTGAVVHETLSYEFARP